MNFRKRLCAVLACGAFVLTGCAADKKADSKTRSDSQKGSDDSIVQTDEKDTQQTVSAEDTESRRSVDEDIPDEQYMVELDIISEETDRLMTALCSGDVNTLADMLVADSKWGKFFDEHRDSVGLSNILREDFGDLVWTLSEDDEKTDILWLRSAEMQQRQYTQSYVTAGVKEMIYFSEYFLLNYGDGSVLPEDYAPEDEAQAEMLLTNTMKKLPLLKNHWSIPCTMPDEDGRVYFNLDEDFIMDYTKLDEIKDFTEETMYTEYIKLLAVDRGKVRDEEARTEESNDLRVELMGLLRECEFEEAWQLLKPNADKGLFADVPEYDRLTPEQQEKVDDFVQNKVRVVISDYSTEVDDETRRRHIFCHIYYDAIAEDDEKDIEVWLKEHEVKQSNDAVYFDITTDDKLPLVLDFYFDAIERVQKETE